MTLKEKLKWEGQLVTRLRDLNADQAKILSGKAQRVNYYFFVGTSVWYAVEVYVEGDAKNAKSAAEIVVKAALDYFYGKWRDIQSTSDGKTGGEAWKPYCLWYDEVMQSLPFATALSDWNAMKRIAEYPPEDKLPEAAKAKGETAWGWALIYFLRGESKGKVEEFLAKAENDKAKRPKLLCPILRALLNNDAAQFEKTLLTYLVYYRKSEFKAVVNKILSFDGTTLYHLGRKQGFKVELPENVADHVIRFP